MLDTICLSASLRVPLEAETARCAAHNNDSKRQLCPMKRQYQPSKIRRVRQHGFLSRMATRGGRKVIRNRRRNGRKKLTPV